jgi:outer membrane receptor protein involved in Fe transport
MPNSISHRCLIAASGRMVFAALLLGACQVWAANINETRAFDIKPQSLDKALIDFSKQAGFQIVADSADVAKLQTRGVSGTRPIGAALDEVLAGSGLSYRVIGPDVITIERRNGSAATSSNSTVEKTSQSSGEKSGEVFKIESIRVTAQKREERLIDVPISIVALSNDELQKRQITNLDDLQFAVPGLSIQGAGVTHVIQLRGISNPIGGGALVGLYIDEADATVNGTRAITPITYDLNRVEVLRGPQGTLYGEGSAGGTIRFITKNPDLSSFAMSSDVSALFTQGGAPSHRLNAMLNMPLVENQFALRFAGTFKHDGGWIDQPFADRRDINGETLTNARLKALWQPTSRLAINAMAQIYRNDRSSGVEQGEGHNFVQRFNLTTTPAVTNRDELYNVTLAYDLASARALSSTTLINAKFDIRDWGQTVQLTPPVPNVSSSFDFYVPDQLISDRIFVQEFRLTSIGSGPWQWTTGIFYRDYRDESGSQLQYFDQPGPPGTPLPDAFAAPPAQKKAKSWSAFGDTSYEFGNLTIGAGVRFFHDEQKLTNLVAATTQSGTFHSVDPRAYVQYKLADKVNLYASAAKGFRSGGFNGPNQPHYDPDSVRTYEMGTKMSLLQGRLGVNAALFWSDFKDYQVIGIAFVPPNRELFLTDNAGNARIKGIEWDLAWRPADQWALYFSGDYLDTRFTKIDIGNSNYHVGDPVDYVPNYQITASAQRDFTWAGKPGFVRADYSQQGRMSYRFRSIGPWAYGQSDVIRLVNLKAHLAWNDKLGLALFGENLLNDRGFITPFSNTATGRRLRPRTVGLEFDVAF